jgi:hypothetical protein
MPLGCIQVDEDAFPPVTMTCVRCGAEAPMRFAGPCEKCVGELRAKYQAVAREVDGATYEPKMNVTPNAVALKDD